MTVNVDGLIHNLGKSYQDLLDAELVPYKAPPTGFSGDPDLSLDMAKEGLFLSFLGEKRILKAITLYIQRDGTSNWVFPNSLPEPFEYEMSRDWINITLGQPLKSVAPRKILRHSLGWVDKYNLNDASIPITLQIDYDLCNLVKEISYILTSEMRW